MKIALVTRRFDPAGGGTERDLMITARILTQAGHRLTFYAAEVRAAASQWPVRRLAAPWMGRALGLWWFARSAAPMARADGAELVLSFARIADADILRSGGGAHSSYIGAARRWQTHGQAAAMRLSPYHRVQVLVERLGFRSPRLKRAIAVSDLVRRDLVKTFGLAPETAVTLYNGVDLDKFRPAAGEAERTAIRDALGVGPDEMVSFFVGDGFARKGLRFLIEAWPALGGSPHLLVVGTDRAARSFERLAHRHGARAHFLGRRSDVDRILRGGDALALPSLFEPFGNVALEAMASGLPVLTTANCGVAEVVPEAMRRFIVGDPGSRIEVSARMGDLLARAHALRTVARQTAERFTWERHARELLAIVDDAAAPGR